MAEPRSNSLHHEQMIAREVAENESQVFTVWAGTETRKWKVIWFPEEVHDKCMWTHAYSYTDINIDTCGGKHIYGIFQLGTIANIPRSHEQNRTAMKLPSKPFALVKEPSSCFEKQCPTWTRKSMMIQKLLCVWYQKVKTCLRNEEETWQTIWISNDDQP